MIIRLSDDQLVKKRVEKMRFGKWRPLRWFVKECYDCGMWTRAWKPVCHSCRVNRWLDSL